MKKIISLLLATAMTVTLCACQGAAGAAPAAEPAAEASADSGEKLDIKAGFICLHDEN